MTILDIDLDSFLSEIQNCGSGTPRLEDRYFTPWTESEVRSFLEKRCRLSVERPVPGMVVTEHDEVFWIWKQLIREGKLTAPFDVVHVDAHADLSMMDAAIKYVSAELLHEDLEGRANPKARVHRGLAPGNYLVFAIACRWLSKLVYVHHRKLRMEWLDIPRQVMKDMDPASGVIQLRKFARDHDFGTGVIDGWTDPIDLEPQVRLELVNPDSYQAERVADFVFLAKSPSFTPPAADALVPIIAEYIDDLSLTTTGSGDSS